MSKMTIIGFEANSGVGKNSGKAYAMGSLHTMAKLAPAFTEGGTSVGQAGTTYQCDVPLIDKIKHLQPPFSAEVETETVLRFGKREEMVIDIKPLERIKAS